MKVRVMGAVALTVIVAAGCGTEEGDATIVRDTADVIGDTADDVAAADLPTVLTEEEVSAAWEDRAQRKALQSESNDIYVDVLEAECVVTDAYVGEARCTQSVKIGSYRVPSVKDVTTDMWRVTYDPETGVFRTVR